MKCPKCGKEIADDSIFCEFCGTKIKRQISNRVIWIALSSIAVGVIVFAVILASSTKRGNAINPMVSDVSYADTLVSVEANVKGKEPPFDTKTNSASNVPLMRKEIIQSAGFRFFKESYKVTGINKIDNRICDIYVGKYLHEYIGDRVSYYGGHLSKNGLLNGVILIDSHYKYVAFVCEGKQAFPVLEVSDYNGLFMSLNEGVYSYAYINKDGRLCESMSEVFGRDFSDLNILRDIYFGTIDLTELENAFTEFVRSGKKLRDFWKDDPKYTSLYEGLEPIVEGYKQGDFDETIDRYRPLNDGILVYSQIPEFYCDGVYSDEPIYKNGHALHTSTVKLNPNHFRVIFSFKALSNKGWCQGHSDDEQWPLMNDERNLGVRLTNDGNITIMTEDSKRKEHYYVTGYNYSVNNYFDIDMEYDHGQFIINGHRFNMSIKLDSNQSFHSVNYSVGNVFKGYIKGLEVYSYPD